MVLLILLFHPPPLNLYLEVWGFLNIKFSKLQDAFSEEIHNNIEWIKEHKKMGTKENNPTNTVNSVSTKTQLKEMSTTTRHTWILKPINPLTAVPEHTGAQFLAHALPCPSILVRCFLSTPCHSRLNSGWQIWFGSVVTSMGKTPKQFF